MYSFMVCSRSFPTHTQYTIFYHWGWEGYHTCLLKLIGSVAQVSNLTQIRGEDCLNLQL